MTDAVVHENTVIGEKNLTFRHKSGLTVRLSPKKLSTDYAMLTVRYGSMHTKFRLKGEREFRITPHGIAHFLEHKLFTMPDGTDGFEAFASIGAEANAYTTLTRTSYLFSCVSHFEEALEILMRMVLSPCFREADVIHERDIIKQELLANEDQASTRLYRSVMRNMFDTHPIRENIGGTVGSIGEITPELLYLCYQAFYNPSRMLLSLSGNMSMETVICVLDRVFAECKTSDLPAVEEAPVCDERGSVLRSYEEFSMSLSKPMLQFGIKDVTYSEKEPYMTRRQLLACMALELLFGGAGALYEELQDAGIMQKGFSWEHAYEPGCAYILIEAKTSKPAYVSERIRQTLEEARKNPPTESDFERMRKCYYADFVRLFDSTEEIAEAVTEDYFGGLNTLDEGDVIYSLTYDEFTSLITELFRPDMYTVSVVRPLDAQPINATSKEECL